MKSIGKVRAVLEGSSDEILQMVDRIRAGDKTSEGVVKKGGWASLASCLSGFGILGLGAMFPTMDSQILKFLTLLAVVAFVASIIIAMVGSSGDVEDSRYESLEKLHRFMEKDCGHNTVFHYELDLRPLTHRSFYTHQEKFGGGIFSLPRGTHKYFTAPVVKARYTLRDGTRVQVEMAKITRETRKTKRGLSGKVKTKTKCKYKDLYTCRVKLPTGVELNRESWRVTNSPQFTGESPKVKTEGNKLSSTLVRKRNQIGVDPTPLLQLLTLLFHKVHSSRAAG